MRSLALAVGLPLFLGACGSAYSNPAANLPVADAAAGIRPQATQAIQDYSPRQPTGPGNWTERNRAQTRKGMGQ